MVNNEHQAYDTHLNYINCLVCLTENINLKSNYSLKKVKIPEVENKKNLIELTKKSLNDEYKIVQIDKDYSYASTSWLPIKSYYLIFNILLTIEYILKVQKSSFKISHSRCIDEFTRKLKEKEIEFSNDILNQVFDSSILQHKVKSGANLSHSTPNCDMYKMAIRKIAIYKTEDWKQKNHIDLRKKAHKIKYQQYLNSFLISIFDFPYYMRIRSNYRDFAFIDGVSIDETANYFNKFFSFTVFFVKSLERLKKDLINMRV